MEWVGRMVVAFLFVDDTVLFAYIEEKIQRVVDEFESVCTKRKLKIKAWKSKVMIYERRELEVFDFNTPYRVNVPAVVLWGRENGESESFSIWEQRYANMKRWKEK